MKLWRLARAAAVTRVKLSRRARALLDFRVWGRDTHTHTTNWFFFFSFFNFFVFFFHFVFVCARASVSDTRGSEKDFPNSFAYRVGRSSDVCCPFSLHLKIFINSCVNAYAFLYYNIVTRTGPYVRSDRDNCERILYNNYNIILRRREKSLFFFVSPPCTLRRGLCVHIGTFS